MSAFFLSAASITMSIDIRRCADHSVSDRHGRRYSGADRPDHCRACADQRLYRFRCAGTVVQLTARKRLRQMLHSDVSAPAHNTGALLENIGKIAKAGFTDAAPSAAGSCGRPAGVPRCISVQSYLCGSLSFG